MQHTETCPTVCMKRGSKTELKLEVYFLAQRVSKRGVKADSKPSPGSCGACSSGKDIQGWSKGSPTAMGYQLILSNHGGGWGGDVLQRDLLSAFIHLRVWSLIEGRGGTKKGKGTSQALTLQKKDGGGGGLSQTEGDHNKF